MPMTDVPVERQMKAENTFSLLQAKEDQRLPANYQRQDISMEQILLHSSQKEPILQYLVGGLLAYRPVRQCITVAQASHQCYLVMVAMIN